MSDNFFKFKLILPTVKWGDSDILHYGKVHTKELSFMNKFSLTSNETYVNLIIVIFGFGIQIEIKE